MKTYFTLAESIVTILEGRVDQLKLQNPNISSDIDKYASIDTTPTKKFVPWLVSQHKKGNVTPNDADVQNVVRNFDRYKKQHGMVDHSKHSYQEVRDAIKPLIGKAATKAEKTEEGIDKIHDKDGIQAFHIKTKDASQNKYGGGERTGGRYGTNWCVSARSGDCMFGTYGDLYTIHKEDDPNSPYAVHPKKDKNSITTRYNDGDNNIDEVLKNKPELKPAVDKIRKHYKEKKDERDKLIKMLKSPNATEEHLNKALNDEDKDVRKAAANHPNATEEHLNKALNDEDSDVRKAAANHSNATKEHLNKALNDEYSDVRKAAASHPNATKEHLNEALS